jgi:hypothetical protein
MAVYFPRLSLAVFAFAVVSVCLAEEIIPLYDGPSGATCDYYNAAALIPWKRRGGDWIDSRGKPEGFEPYAERKIAHENRIVSVQWDVTELVQRWLEQPSSNRGLLVQAIPATPSGVIDFYSREGPEPSLRPRLRITFSGGGEKDIPPTADTSLHCSTNKSLGKMEFLRIGGGYRTLLYFDTRNVSAAGSIQRAVLELTKRAEGQTGAATAGVYELDAPRMDRSAQVRRGLADRYRYDQGIERDPAVIKFEGFEGRSWASGWAIQKESVFRVVDRDDGLRFEPLQGKALRVTVKKGGNLGLNMEYYLEKGNEPEEVYFRYYQRFGDNWAPIADGGKMPGVAGTYGMQGRSTGTNGWSIRSEFLRKPERENPLARYTIAASYAYHADQKDRYGDLWVWSLGPRGFLENNRWYAIEHYVKMNTPGRNDGIYRVWLDGRLVFEKTDIRYRDIPRIKIQKIHVNYWHGGMTPSPYDQDVFIDNLVVSREYVGPMAR